MAGLFDSKPMISALWSCLRYPHFEFRADYGASWVSNGGDREIDSWDEARRIIAGFLKEGRSLPGWKSVSVQSA
jgi:hypothetical protein